MSQKSGRDPKPRSKRKLSGKRADVVLIQGVSEDGESLAVLRAREDRVEAGIVRSVKEGQPIDGELLRLKPRADFPLLCDVEVDEPQSAINAAGGSDTKADHNGPAQVATPNYRANWDAIWNKPKAGKKALPN